MTTQPSTTDRGVTDAEVEAALQGLRFTATGIPKHEDMRRALEAFAASRPSAQGGERVEPLESSETRKAAYTAVALLREGQMAMHGGEFDQYRMAMCTAASILEAMLAVPAPGGLLDEMRAFINLIKGAALLGEKAFTPERCRHIFEECVRLNGRYLDLATPPATSGNQDSLVRDAERMDFLDAMGGDWIARHSTTGRGYRLHQDRDGPHATARAAIDAAIRAGRKG